MYYYPGKMKTYVRAFNKARASRFAALQLAFPGFPSSENARSTGYSNTRTLTPMGAFAVKPGARF